MSTDKIIPYEKLRKLIEQDLVLQAISNLRQADIDRFVASCKMTAETRSVYYLDLYTGK